MPAIDYTAREIRSRVLYLGAERVGKATNLDHIYVKTGPGRDETPGRDYWEEHGLEMTLGEIRGFKNKLHLWPVVGAPFYGSSRKLLMGHPGPDGIAGIVWVVDSSPERLEANEIMAEMFREELVECGFDPARLPIVLQYNKRDVPSAIAIDQLHARFNPTGAPEFEAIATGGVGVFDCVKMIAKLVLTQLRS
jgi:hypothetical protein